MRKSALLLLPTVFLVVTGCAHHNQDAPKTVKQASQHKVVVIVVDSLTDRTLKRIVQSSDFPAFRYLMTHGTCLPRVVSSFPSMTVSDVSTLITGTYPESHHVPGLVWMDVHSGRIVNYGNNLRQTLTLGIKPVAEDALLNLNQKHLSKSVRTIFEDLQDAGYSTGAINMPVYRGRSTHQLFLPALTRPIVQKSSFNIQGPNLFVLGNLNFQTSSNEKSGVFQRYGFNDDFGTSVLVNELHKGHLPDFTMVYLPDNDTIVHKKGIDSIEGIQKVEKKLQKVLGAYENWDKTLSHVSLVVMGDSGISPVLPKDQESTIILKKLLSQNQVHQWGTSTNNKQIGLAVNSRMAYVYLLNGQLNLSDVALQLVKDKRVDIVAWSTGNSIAVISPESPITQFIFKKGGRVKDLYSQTWTIHGNSKLLDVKFGKDHILQYGKYPDALQQLWSALHSHPGRYLVVTAKRGYQFGDENAPEHSNGAQQASLLNEDVLVPVIISGTSKIPQEPVRFVDLKQYFISLVKTTKS